MEENNQLTNETMPQHDECIHDAEFRDIREDFKEIRNNDKGAVTWTIFWSIILLLVGIFGGVIATNTERITKLEDIEEALHKEVNEKVHESEIAQAKIDVQYAEIQKQLVEINLKIARLK